MIQIKIWFAHVHQKSARTSTQQYLHCCTPRLYSLSWRNFSLQVSWSSWTYEQYYTVHVIHINAYIDDIIHSGLKELEIVETLDASVMWVRESNINSIEFQA